MFGEIKKSVFVLVLFILFNGAVMEAAVPSAPTHLRELTGTVDKNISIGWDYSCTSGVDEHTIYYVTGEVADGNLTYHKVEKILCGDHYMVNEVPIVSGSTPGMESLDPYTSYRFSVSASNSDGESEKSNIISVKTLHTWHGALKACLNNSLSKDADYIVDRQDTEGVTTFYCNGVNILENGTMDELRDLVYIRDLNISDSTIYLAFPSWITELTHLFSLKLHGQYLTGAVPADIGSQLPNIQYLDLAGNKLTGSIPTSISQMSDLTVLDLSSNEFNGTVPASLGTLTWLKTLKLKDNNLSGALPNELSALATSLIELSLGGNDFTSLPNWIGSFVNLKSLELDKWPLRTSFPTSLKSLILLEKLSMSECKIQGHLPEWIGLLDKLQVLDLHSNDMFGTVPESIRNLTQLQMLNLQHNCNLYTDDADVQSFIRWNCEDPISTQDCVFTTYELELPDTNTHQCDMGMTPIRYFLLD